MDIGRLAAFSEADIQAMEPMMKIGLVATVSPEGLPHVTLISSLRANTPTQLTFGQFVEGRGKEHLRHNPRAGFLVMTLDRTLWRGQATFTHTARQGPEYDLYNRTPMFRYNAYFGIHTVYFLDLAGHTGRQALPMGQIVAAALRTMAARAAGGREGAPGAISLWTRGLMNKLDNLKFVAYVDAAGYPVIVPAIQAQAAGGDTVLFSTGAYTAELEAIPAGVPLAVFAMSLQMEDVLLRGEYQGIGRVAGVRCGRVRVDWAYNPMPPTPGQVYPAVELRPVTTF